MTAPLPPPPLSATPLLTRKNMYANLYLSCQWYVSIMYLLYWFLYISCNIDERKDYCYHSDGDNGEDTSNNTLIPGPIQEECTEKFPMNFTRAQCCCNIGTHYGSKICEACPEKDTGIVKSFPCKSSYRVLRKILSTKVFFPCLIQKTFYVRSRPS